MLNYFNFNFNFNFISFADIPVYFKARAHYVAPFLFHLVATKRCKLFAHKGLNKKGRVEVWHESLSQRDNEYEIGSYNRLYLQRYGIYSISYNHDCITKYQNDELRNVNTKKPFILNISARKKHEDLNKAKPKARTHQKEEEEEIEEKKDPDTVSLADSQATLVVGDHN